MPKTDWKSEVADRQRSAKTAGLAAYAERIGSSPGRLLDYGVGWDARGGCWCVPMYDGTATAKGLFPCGLSLLDAAGRPTYALPGSANGLYVPRSLWDRSAGMATIGLSAGMAAIAPSFLAAALCPVAGVGRPNPHAGTAELGQLANRLPPTQWIVLADRGDGPRVVNGVPVLSEVRGPLDAAQRLARTAPLRAKGWIRSSTGRDATPRQLAAELAACPVRFVTPPKGFAGDVVDWLRSCRPSDFMAEVMLAHPVTPAWLAAAERVYETRLGQEKARAA